MFAALIDSKGSGSLARAKKTPEKNKDVPEGISQTDVVDSAAEGESEGFSEAENVKAELKDSDVDAIPEPKGDPLQKVVPPMLETERKNTFLPLVLGGAIAAALGFGASQYIGDQGWPFAQGPSATDELARIVDAQKSEIGAMSARIDELIAAATESVRDTETRFVDVDAAINASKVDLRPVVLKFEGLETRLTDLENRPIPDVGATANAVSAYERELKSMREMLALELSKIENAQDQALQVEETAAVTAEKAIISAALAKLDAAIETGESFRTALETIKGTGAAVPAILNETADTGVPTLLELQQGFSDFARSAQSSSIKGAADKGEIGKFSAFLQRQLGTRSLEPQEGDTANAILSRAEDALRRSDISKSLKELELLPESGRAEMAAWMTLAKTRLDGLAAVSALTELSYK